MAGRSVAVRSWQQILPEVASYIRLDRGTNLVFQCLLIFLILFTIFNTLLMSVLERRREFGVLLALGTEPGRLRLQIFFESVFLGLLGCGAGLICGGLISWLVHVHGIDMSAMLGEGVNVSGFALTSKMHTKVSGRYFVRGRGHSFYGHLDSEPVADEAGDTDCRGRGITIGGGGDCHCQNVPA